MIQLVEGTHTCNVTMTVFNASTAPEYDNYPIPDVVATIMDDDS